MPQQRQNDVAPSALASSSLDLSHLGRSDITGPNVMSEVEIFCLEAGTVIEVYRWTVFNWPSLSHEMTS